MVVSRELGLNIPENIVDLRTGAHKTPEMIALNANGKLPILELDDGSTLWESNAICNRLAAETDTPLWPKSNARYDIMRWQFWEGCHFNPAAGKFIAYHFFGNKSIDLDAAAEDFAPLAAVLDGHLANREWLVGDTMTTADISVAAILCYREMCHIPVTNLTNIERWLGQLEATTSWKSVNMAPEAA